jgi:hypothetical protein
MSVGPGARVALFGRRRARCASQAWSDNAGSVFAMTRTHVVADALARPCRLGGEG